MPKGVKAVALFFATLVAAGCSQPVSIASVTVSLDQTRLEIILSSCNAELGVSVNESPDAVTVVIDDSARQPVELAGTDCQDLYIHQMEDALGTRPVVNDATGDRIDVQASLSEEELDWPYDKSRVSQAQYEQALDDVVGCVMENDPDVSAWVEQQLNWKWWSWEKEPNADGTVSSSAIQPCEQLHLDPVR